jgi:spore coat polysaccharide biosynthesis protein SpsF (cytidylyltransferase family)
MKRLMLILISSICLFGNSDLEKERELQLQKFKSYLDVEALSTDCKISIKDLIKKNIEYNIAFDNFLKNKNSSYDTAYSNLRNAEKYSMTICTKKDFDFMKETHK